MRLLDTFFNIAVGIWVGHFAHSGGVGLFAWAVIQGLDQIYYELKDMNKK